MFGFPIPIRGCLFDMDGVLTDTASVHAVAWKQLFDGFLAAWATEHEVAFVPFDAARDYREFVDGKPREDGVRSFLASRGIDLDSRRTGTSVEALSDGKNGILLRLLQKRGVRAFPGSVSFLAAVRAAGWLTAVVSASANTSAVLAAAGLAGQFDDQVDGLIAKDLGLAGKPSPDSFLHAASVMGLRPEEAAVFEDSVAGVAAARAGRFGVVVGVDRTGNAAELTSHGADIVVGDLAELLER